MSFNHAVVLAQVDGNPRQSILGWMIEAVGLVEFSLILLTGLLMFFGACWVVRNFSRPSEIATFLVVLPLPLLLAIFSALKGLVASLAVLSLTNQTLTPAELAGGTAAMLLPILLSLAVSLPTYFVLASGLLYRTYRPSSGKAVESAPAIPSPARPQGVVIAPIA